LSLLRAATIPDAEQDQGNHEFSFARAYPSSLSLDYPGTEVLIKSRLGPHSLPSSIKFPFVRRSSRSSSLQLPSPPPTFDFDHSFDSCPPASLSHLSLTFDSQLDPRHSQTRRRRSFLFLYESCQVRFDDHYTSLRKSWRRRQRLLGSWRRVTNCRSDCLRRAFPLLLGPREDSQLIYCWFHTAA